VKIRLVCVGKPRDRVLAELHERYAERIRRFGVGYETAHVAEVRADGRFSEDHVRQREGRALIDAHGGAGRIIALDPTGRCWSSEQLAERIEGWGTPAATLLIGGPLGLHEQVRTRAEAVWSLSPLTFPHELARVLIAEQVYRALCIRRGVPYHK
jgi:23S rRNA (pseudouridine1915-N3)-methyltransferase